MVGDGHGVRRPEHPPRKRGAVQQQDGGTVHAAHQELLGGSHRDSVSVPDMAVVALRQACPAAAPAQAEFTLRSRDPRMVHTRSALRVLRHRAAGYQLPRELLRQQRDQEHHRRRVVHEYRPRCDLRRSARIPAAVAHTSAGDAGAHHLEHDASVPQDRRRGTARIRSNNNTARHREPDTHLRAVLCPL